MKNLTIKDDNENYTSYTLENFNISVHGNSLSLELYLDNSVTVKYEIYEDIREPNIANINAYITNQLKNVCNDGKPVKISEYLQRNYIYIGKADNIRQFTAHKNN